MKTIITNVANVPPALNPDHQDKMFMKGSIYRLTDSGGVHDSCQKVEYFQ